MIKLVLWRHGRTDFNHEHRIQGQLDSQLDEVGLAQAAAAAPRLAALHPDLIVSSDLSRAWRTAHYLAESTGLSVEPDQRLRERHFGRWQGLLRDEIAQHYPAEAAAGRAGVLDPDPTIEPLAELAERVRKAFVEIAGRLADGGTAVLVTHGAAARAGSTVLLGLPLELFRVFGVLDNCATSHLSHSGEDPERGWALQAHNL